MSTNTSFVEREDYRAVDKGYIDITDVNPYDYNLTIGIRKIARFDYERKPRNYYDGTENQLAFSAPTSAFKGLEYQFHYEKERFRGENYDNHRYFIKHTGWPRRGQTVVYKAVQEKCVFFQF